ncbi:MAG: RbsD/FucU family protein [Cucumibacter sp.]
MLKGIPGVIHAELLHVLASMGHGDELVIADANFPAARDAKRLIRTSGISTSDLAAAILTLVPLDEYVEAPLGLMKPERPQDRNAPALKELRAALAKIAPGVKIEDIPRSEFYPRARNAFAIVATSDMRPYANVLLKMGVIAGRADGR